MDKGTITGNAILGRVRDRTSKLGASKRVLLIDADQNWQQQATSWLVNAGYTVLIAHDAYEGFQKAGPNLGLIVLDLNLAGESGLILSTYLKRNYPEVPILLCTGMDHDDSTIRAMLDMGPDQYLHKGTMHEFLVTIGTFFKELPN
jgi:DNA-binding response OmpR family regulator